MKNYLQYLIGLLFVLLIYGIHMLPVSDSMLNENNTKLSNAFLASQIRYHQEFAPFARRPLTSILIEGTSSVSGATLGESFVLVNFLFLFISGILIYRTSLLLKASRRWALFNMATYFLTFSILFAFFPPVFSYDEPLQYCLIILSIIALIREKWISYVLLFLLALIARESTVFLWPGLAVIFLGVDWKSKFGWSALVKRKLFLLFLPIPLYALYLGIFLWATGIWEETSVIATSRMDCFRQNFDTFPSSVETLISCFLVLGPSLYFLFMGVRGKAFSMLEKKYVQAFWISMIINTPIVMIATLARETRLYALPLVFLWPFIGQLFGKDIVSLLSPRLYLECFKNWKYSLSLLVFCLINCLISFVLYVPSFPAKDNFFNEYLFVLLLMLSLHFLLTSFSGKGTRASQ